MRGRLRRRLACRRRSISFLIGSGRSPYDRPCWRYQAAGCCTTDPVEAPPPAWTGALTFTGTMATVLPPPPFEVVPPEPEPVVVPPLPGYWVTGAVEPAPPAWTGVLVVTGRMMTELPPPPLEVVLTGAVGVPPVSVVVPPEPDPVVVPPVPVVGADPTGTCPVGADATGGDVGAGQPVTVAPLGWPVKASPRATAGRAAAMIQFLNRM